MLKGMASVCDLLRGFDGEGEVLEDEGKVGGVAECHIREDQCPATRPVGGKGLMRGCGLQRGFRLQLTVCHYSLCRYHLRHKEDRQFTC